VPIVCWRLHKVCDGRAFCEATLFHTEKFTSHDKYTFQLHK